jgi:hypothetical protein
VRALATIALGYAVEEISRDVLRAPFMKAHDIGKLIHEVVMSLVSSNVSLEKKELLDTIRRLIVTNLASKDYLKDSHMQYSDLISSIVHSAIPIFEAPIEGVDNA